MQKCAYRTGPECAQIIEYAYEMGFSASISERLKCIGARTNHLAVKAALEF